MSSRTRKVGTGSRVQDLIGDIMMMRRTSAGVHGRNDDSIDDVKGDVTHQSFSRG